MSDKYFLSPNTRLTIHSTNAFFVRSFVRSFFQLFIRSFAWPTCLSNHPFDSQPDYPPGRPFDYSIVRSFAQPSVRSSTLPSICPFDQLSVRIERSNLSITGRLHYLRATSKDCRAYHVKKKLPSENLLFVIVKNLFYQMYCMQAIWLFSDAIFIGHKSIYVLTSHL